MKAVFTDYQYDSIEQEKTLCRAAGIDVEEYQEKDADKLRSLVADADAVVTQYSDINRSVIESMGNCKLIIKYGIGVNNIDIRAAAEKGIYVCNVPDYGVEEVSDHTVALIFALYRKLPLMTKSLREGEWNYTPMTPVSRFAESVVGLLGFGRIPRMVAGKLSGFGVKILACDPYAPKDTFSQTGVEQVDFETLCEKSDYLSIHCPLTGETKGLFNRDVFRRMKNTSYLINTARGPVVCEKDLTEALKLGEIAGAAIDVFEKEPPEKSNSLIAMEQVIATPHCAWYSEQAIHALQKKVGEEIVNVLQGNAPFHCVNMKDIKN